MYYWGRICIWVVLLTLGCGNFAFAADTVKIGSVFAKSGPTGTTNLNHVQAVRFAVDEINRNGGLIGKKVELIEFDNHGTPIQSKIAAKKAVKARVCGVIGASWSDHSLYMAPVLQKAKIPMITPDSTHPKVTRVGDYIFRGSFTNSFQSQALARFAVDELGLKKAVTIVDVTSAFSLDLGDYFKKRFTSLGGKILAEFEYKYGDTDFMPFLEKVKALNPEILFIPGHEESGSIIKQAQDIGINAVVLGGDGWGFHAFYSNGGQELKKGYYTSHWDKGLDSPKSKDFVERYRKSYELNDFSGVVYDSVMLLADAIKRAGSDDPEKIRDALAATDNYEGVVGNYTFDENGDPTKGVLIMEVTNGKAKPREAITP